MFQRTSSAVPPGKSTVLLVSGLALGLAVLAILIVSFVSMRRESNLELCGAHLLMIYRSIRTGELLDSPRWDAAGTGRAFLTNAAAWPTRQPIPFEAWCPVRGPSGDVDYRGPARPLRLLSNQDPILADRPGNHGPGKGGNVMLKTGAVSPARPSDPLWERAAQTTAD
jgi:hypothetical protein